MSCNPHERLWPALPDLLAPLLKAYSFLRVFPEGAIVVNLREQYPQIPAIPVEPVIQLLLQGGLTQVRLPGTPISEVRRPTIRKPWIPVLKGRMRLLTIPAASDRSKAFGWDSEGGIQSPPRLRSGHTRSRRPQCLVVGEEPLAASTGIENENCH